MNPATSTFANLLPDQAILSAERALLGAILLEGAQRIPPLLAEEFYLERHRVIWRLIGELAEGCDLVTLAAELATRGQLDAAGGAAYLAQLAEEGALALQVTKYAQLVRLAARARKIRQLGAEMARQGLDPEEIQRRLAELPGPMASHGLER